MKICKEGGGEGWFQGQVGWKLGGEIKSDFERMCGWVEQT